jgi:hypothetical protein
MVVACVSLAGCASQGEQLKLYKFAPMAAPAELQDGKLSVSIQRAQSAAGATNYVLHVLVANNGIEPVDFKSTAIEVVDADGVTHPPIRPGVGLMTMSGVLADQSIAPARRIKGALYFQTATGDARSPTLTIQFGQSKLTLKNAGFLSDEELKANSAFRD